MGKNKRAKLPTIRSLYADCIDVRSVNVDDWSTLLGFDGEDDKGVSIEADKCEKCGDVLVLRGPGGDCSHKDADSDSECDGNIPSAEGPMMNYHYPVGRLDDTDEIARSIAHLPLCLVEWLSGNYSLALTGGGMDLSWQIAEAFMLCGQLPPVNYEPPKMAEELTPRRRHVLSAYLKSCAVMAKRAKAAARRARDTRQWYAERAKVKAVRK